jgi:hypothetical protein
MSGSLFERAIPGNKTYQVAVIAHAAATATEDIAAFVAPYACRVKAVGFVPFASVTGANTNTTHLNVINRGSAGVGTTAVTNYDLISGNNLTGLDVKWISSALTTSLAEYDVLVLQAEKVGSGLDVPAGVFIIEIDGGNAYAS